MSPINATITPDNAADVAKALARRKYGNVQIKPVSTLDAGMVLGIYGKGGAGKTTLAATVTDTLLGSPALILDCFGNTHVVSSYADRLDVAPIEKFADVQAVVSGLEGETTSRYKTLIYDNVTAMIMIRLRELYGPVTDVDWKMHSATSADILQMVINALMLSRGRHKMNILFLWQQATEERTVNGEKNFVFEVAANKAIQEQFPGLVPFIGRLYLKSDIPPYSRMLDFTPLEKVQQSKTQFDPKHPTAKTIPMKIYRPSLAPLLETLRNNVPFPADKHKEPVA